MQRHDRAKRDAVLRQLKRKGLSVRQVERLTGINWGVSRRRGKAAGVVFDDNSAKEFVKHYGKERSQN